MLHSQAGWQTQAPIGPARYILDVETLSGIWHDLNVRLEQILHIEVNSSENFLLQKLCYKYIIT